MKVVMILRPINQYQSGTVWEFLRIATEDDLKHVDNTWFDGWCTYKIQ